MIRLDCLRLGLVAAVVAGLGFGCATDPHADADTDASGDGDGDGDGDPSGDGDTDATVDDLDGVYLLAIETTLGPDLPIQMVLTVSDGAVIGPGILADLSMQPLSLWQGETLSPREFVGRPFVYTEVAFDPDLGFELDLGSLLLPGAANPFTGSDMTFDIQLSGAVVNANAWCGDVIGFVTSPLVFDLAGSTFAAIRLADDGSDPATLPTSFPYGCP